MTTSAFPSRRHVLVAGTCAWLADTPMLSAAAAKPRELPSLAQAFAPFFPVGIAVTPGQVMMGDTAFLARQFSALVAENAMKPESLARAGEGRYEFSQADEIVNLAAKHGMFMRGHTLVWHHQMPPWFFGNGAGGDASREVLIGRMKKYITDVVGHFKGRVRAWDVVNEAFVTGSEAQVDADGWRVSPWTRIIGRDYIDLAFQFAHDADPQALLFYNDYESQHPPKRRLILQLARDLKARGVAIHGIGHQAHCTVAHPNMVEFEQAIVEVAQLGLVNHITELDISLNRAIGSSEVSEATPKLLEQQARKYVELFEMFMRQRDKIGAVMMWGLNDAVSWLRQWPQPRFDAPLLFDDAMHPKPAFWKLIELAGKPARKSAAPA